MFFYAVKAKLKTLHPSFPSLLAMSALQRALLRVLYERSGRGRMSQEQPGTPVTQAPQLRVATKEQVDAGAVCRFCFEGATSSRLVAPCSCSGTQEFVHELCLRKWQRASACAGTKADVVCNV